MKKFAKTQPSVQRRVLTLFASALFIFGGLAGAWTFGHEASGVGIETNTVAGGGQWSG